MDGKIVWLIHGRGKGEEWYLCPNAGVFLTVRDARWWCEEQAEEETEEGFEWKPVAYEIVETEIPDED